MTFPILGGNSAVAGGYSIDNSLRFNRGDSPYLSRTPSSAGNRKTWTWSGWVKNVLGTNGFSILRCWQDDSNFTGLTLDSNGQFSYIDRIANSNQFYLNTTPLLRDPSAWYHFTFVSDTTQATASDRFKFYVNGVQITDFDSETYPSQNFETRINNTVSHKINILEETGGSGTQYSDAYLAECHFIDGQQLSPTDFGEFDEDSGIWKPIEYTGTYGTNGFYLDFENSGSLGADQSGNGNNFTPTNLASTDQTTDTPTNNWCTANPLDQSGCTFSEGNLKLVTPTAGGITRATFGMSTGKWYWEVRATTNGNVSSLGILKTDNPVNQYLFQADDGYTYEANTGNKFNNGSGTSYGATYTTGDIIGISYDADAGDLEFFKNGVSQGTAYTGLTGTFAPSFSDGSGDTAVTYDINFGQNGSFNGTETAQGNADQNGYGDFYYAPPSGYLALCTQNLATELSPTIDDGSQYFNTVLWSGTGSGQSITGMGFQPDWLWFKQRNGTSSHALIDSSRGVNQGLVSNSTSAEVTSGASNDLVSFDSDGFTTGTPQNFGSLGSSGTTIVTWGWSANAGSTSSNTDGSITSTVQANTTAGFSIVTWTETTANSQTIGHGLGKTPAMIITKLTDDNVLDPAWYTFHQSIGKGERIMLDSNSGDITSGFFNGTLDSSVFHVSYGDSYDNKSVVAYCFAEIEGYSKFGSYEANNSTDGTFVYTGFKPAWIMLKSADNTGNWFVMDSTRSDINVSNEIIFADLSASEDTSNALDFLSNGFKLRNSGSGGLNYSGTYIYACFSANPFVSSTAIPVTAR